MVPLCAHNQAELVARTTKKISVPLLVARRGAYYCNELCQKVGWPGHKTACKAAVDAVNATALKWADQPITDRESIISALQKTLAGLPPHVALVFPCRCVLPLYVSLCG